MIDLSYISIGHDLAVVRQVTDDAFVMERGATADLLVAPQHPYTRLLRRSVPEPGWKPRRRVEATA